MLAISITMNILLFIAVIVLCRKVYVNAKQFKKFAKEFREISDYYNEQRDMLMRNVIKKMREGRSFK